MAVADIAIWSLPTLAVKELLKVEWLRWPAFLTRDQRGAQGRELQFALLQQPEGGTDDLASRPVATLGKLTVNED